LTLHKSDKLGCALIFENYVITECIMPCCAGFGWVKQTRRCGSRSDTGLNVLYLAFSFYIHYS